MPSPGVMNVLPKLSEDFCIGMLDMRFFVGIPIECESWFGALPWESAVVDDARSVLSLRCAGFESGSNGMPEFSLNFDVAPRGYMTMLTNYHYLDVRSVAPSPSPEEPARISKEVITVFAVELVESDGFGARSRPRNAPARSPAPPPSPTSLVGAGKHR